VQTLVQTSSCKPWCRINKIYRINQLEGHHHVINVVNSWRAIP
jgi:hypothetical protein